MHYFHRIGFGGKVLYKMRKASSTLMPNRSNNNVPGGSGVNPGGVPGGGVQARSNNRSSSRGRGFDGHDGGGGGAGHDDSSSIGSGSLDSGQHSPLTEVRTINIRNRISDGSA